MINFNKEYLDFEKLFIDKSYIFDVSIAVEKTKLMTNQGKIYYVNNIIATKRNENAEIEILLNVTGNFSEYYQLDIEEFRDSEVLKTEIIKYINDNIKELSY